LSEAIIGSNDFSLWADYLNAWDMSNAEGSTNTEAIWYVDYQEDEVLDRDIWSVSSSCGIWYEFAWWPYYYGGFKNHLTFVMQYDNQAGMVRDIQNGRPFRRFMPTKYLLSLFDETKDLRWEGQFKTVWFANSAANINTTLWPRMVVGDTAILCLKTKATPEIQKAAEGKYMVYDLSSIYNEAANDIPLNRNQFCHLSKYMDPTRGSVSQEWSGRDALVLRLAEMYLIAAEAELNAGNKATALSYINTLRRTRAVPGKEAEMEITADQLDMTFILEERARELLAEQNRWFDLKRTGTLIDRVKAYNPDAASNIKSFHQFRPVPLDFLDAIENKEEFGQNEGY
jgi:hypothetical protein